jgi:hypothetical protein
MLLTLTIKPLCDVTVKSCWRGHCQDDVGHGVMPPPSHAGDGADEAYLAMAQCPYRVMLAMTLSR